MAPNTSTAIDLPVTLEHVDTDRLSDAGELTHWHNAVELICVTQGRLRCQTNRDTFLLGTGDLCFINQQQLHRLAGQDGIAGSAVTLVVGTELLAHDPQVYETYVQPVLADAAFTHIQLHGNQERTARIRDELAQIEHLLAERPRAFELELIAHCYLLFRQLYCVLTEREDATEEVDANLALLRQMIEFIREHYAENIKLEDIAQAGAVSKSTCTRLFKRYTERSPVAYLIDYRLEVGASLLRSTRESVGNIAATCGFSQQSYFTRMFQRAFGQTPVAYRRAGEGANATQGAAPS